MAKKYEKIGMIPGTALSAVSEKKLAEFINSKVQKGIVGIKELDHLGGFHYKVECTQIFNLPKYDCTEVYFELIPSEEENGNCFVNIGIEYCVSFKDHN